MPTILLCDDEPALLFTLEEALDLPGYRTVSARSAEEALARLDEADAVVTDLVMGAMSGLDLVRAAKKSDPSLPVILLTARGSERVAVEAMKAGAYDYLTKPFGLDELRLVVGRAVEASSLRRDARRSAAARAVGRTVVGESPRWKGLVDAALRVARREVPILLRGETGTGKELIATMIHAASERRERPCVRVNCAAIPTELAESELFGHAKGAFTGAATSHQGWFSQADGGTLVLDEVGELPLAVQARLLRALQEGEIQPVGAGRVSKVDVRVVASTHRDLAADVAAGRFRQDLYYRLSVVELRVPPLRERLDDVPLLVAAFTERYRARFGLDAVRFTPALVAALAARPWPGNVRELENAVARIVALSEGGTLDLDAMASLDLDAPAPTAATGTLRDQLDAYERALLVDAMRAAKGNQSEAARRLGITRTTLIEKLKRLGVDGR
ncbi:MAG: sigma-54 dependent transcriptional regulator [Polyangiales bacterium]